LHRKIYKAKQFQGEGRTMLAVKIKEDSAISHRELFSLSSEAKFASLTTINNAHKNDT
jgi:hypothetical protein